jgi:hypothetical protein
MNHAKTISIECTINLSINAPSCWIVCLGEVPQYLLAQLYSKWVIFRCDAHVAYWHKADIPRLSSNVRFRR